MDYYGLMWLSSIYPTRSRLRRAPSWLPCFFPRLCEDSRCPKSRGWRCLRSFLDRPRHYGAMAGRESLFPSPSVHRKSKNNSWPPRYCRFYCWKSGTFWWYQGSKPWNALWHVIGEGFNSWKNTMPSPQLPAVRSGFEVVMNLKPRENLRESLW